MVAGFVRDGVEPIVWTRETAKNLGARGRPASSSIGHIGANRMAFHVPVVVATYVRIGRRCGRAYGKHHKRGVSYAFNFRVFSFVYFMH
jgi:hypothetical protein